MREIKFRAWCEVPGTDRRFYYYFSIGQVVPNKYSVLSWEQYTGLKDKTGTEIYEGDIVSYPWINETYLAEIKYDMKRAQFYYSDKKFNGGGHLMVISNIHENPELLNA